MRAARKAAGYNLSGMARALDIAVGQVSNYETGYSRPTADRLAEFCRLCNVSNPLDLYSLAAPKAFKRRPQAPRANQSQAA